MKWFLKCLRQYADFKGRARRKEYWWFTLINYIIILILSFIWIFTTDANGIFLNPALYIILAYCLAIFVPTLSVMVRRLHDIGRSGLWCLYMMIAQFVFSFISAIGNASGNTLSLATLIGGIGEICVFIWMLVWFFTDSQQGENEWGPNPKGEGNAVTESDDSDTIKEDHQSL